MLTEALVQEHVELRDQTAVVGFRQRSGGVEVQLRGTDGRIEKVYTQYISAGDGWRRFTDTPKAGKGRGPFRAKLSDSAVCVVAAVVCGRRRAAVLCGAVRSESDGLLFLDYP